MKTRIIILAIGMLAAATASAQEITVVNNVLGAEGPLYVDGSLYYVSWVSSTLSKWDGKTITVLNHTPGCGHNGLALTKQKTFLIACDDEHGAIERCGAELLRDRPHGVIESHMCMTGSEDRQRQARAAGFGRDPHRVSDAEPHDLHR